MRRIDIESASAAELRKFGRVALGLDIAETLNKPQILGKLQEAQYTQPFILLEEQPAPPGAPAPSNGRVTRPAVRANGEPIRREDGRQMIETRIIINRSERPGGDEPVQVGVNGRLMLIPRGEAVFVREDYLEALEHAVEDVYDPYDGGIGGLKKPRQVQSYPFSYA